SPRPPCLSRRRRRNVQPPGPAWQHWYLPSRCRGRGGQTVRRSAPSCLLPVRPVRPSRTCHSLSCAAAAAALVLPGAGLLLGLAFVGLFGAAGQDVTWRAFHVAIPAVTAGAFPGLRTRPLEGVFTELGACHRTTPSQSPLRLRG